jgi:hypothetical protein
MDKLEQYQGLIKRQINCYVDAFNEETSASSQEMAVFDDERGHYQWLTVGWENGQRAFYTNIYIRLQQGKIWIERDTTEDGIANELLRQGVPREDIVLAFHAPEVRKYTDFAAA